jgi:hypothetical protein
MTAVHGLLLLQRGKAILGISLELSQRANAPRRLLQQIRLACDRFGIRCLNSFGRWYMLLQSQHYHLAGRKPRHFIGYEPQYQRYGYADKSYQQRQRQARTRAHTQKIA